MAYTPIAPHIRLSMTFYYLYGEYVTGFLYHKARQVHRQHRGRPQSTLLETHFVWNDDRESSPEHILRLKNLLDLAKLLINTYQLRVPPSVLDAALQIVALRAEVQQWHSDNGKSTPGSAKRHEKAQKVFTDLSETLQHAPVGPEDTVRENPLGMWPGTASRFPLTKTSARRTNH